jgi:signal transduction histidine kinase
VQFINSFRVRLLLVLAALLIAMLGVQYYLNLLAERNNARVVAEQEQALAAGAEIGVKSISTPDRLIELRDNANQPLLNEGAGRVTNILTVDSDWQIQDSLDPRYLPKENADGTYQYFHLRDVTTLPPLVNAGQIAVDPAQLPPSARNVAQTRAGAPRAFPFPVDTVRGRWYVFVALGRAKAPVGMWNRQAARPLLYTLAVLLVAITVAALLVWRFTRPIEELSAAARRVAAGDFNFHVPAAQRSDEMGQLARVFNEMINRLARTRELEAQLNQAEQSAVVGRLASAIAHEIRNPLNYINLTLDHLRSAFAPEDTQKRETFERLASQLKTEVGRINRHISDFLNYSRPARLELRPLDLRAEIEDALRLVEVQASESNIKMELRSAGEIPPTLGDAEALRSVFTNLFLNAVQAIDGDGGQLTITLTAEEANQRARVDITDTGPGIPSEHISKVFEPYFSTKETGTGLGLAIVKKAIDDHGGTITVTSKQGTGTTFTITLPTERKDEG